MDLSKYLQCIEHLLCIMPEKTQSAPRVYFLAQKQVIKKYLCSESHVVVTKRSIELSAIQFLTIDPKQFKGRASNRYLYSLNHLGLPYLNRLNW